MISVFLFYGIFTLTIFDVSSDSFLEDENPAQVALDEFRRQFGGDDSVLLIYRPQDDNIFSRNSLIAVQQLTDDLMNWRELNRNYYPEISWEELSHIRRIQSLANISSTVRAIMVDIVRPIQTVIPQHHATLMAMVTIGQANALPERNNIHNKKEKISTIRVPRSAIWLSTPCICPIIDGVPTA